MGDLGIFECEQQALTQRHETVTSFELLGALLHHELAQPLAGMQINGELLQILASKMEDGSSIAHLAANVTRDCQRIKSLLEAMGDLFFDRCDWERIHPINLVEVFLAQRKGNGLEEMSVTFEGEADVPEFMGSPILMERVLQNLLNNAQEAIRARQICHGQIHITVCSRPIGIEISVSDNGGGISPDIEPNLFLPGLTSTKKTKSGLGLWLAKRIVAQHQGILSLHNIFGVGARFEMTLPIL